MPNNTTDSRSVVDGMEIMDDENAQLDANEIKTLTKSVQAQVEDVQGTLQINPADLAAALRMQVSTAEATADLLEMEANASGLEEITADGADDEEEPVETASIADEPEPEPEPVSHAPEPAPSPAPDVIAKPVEAPVKTVVKASQEKPMDRTNLFLGVIIFVLLVVVVTLALNR